jgi:glycosyltransferase involved in cell wall biosynthesis
MHAGTPLLASKLVEIEALINTYQIGTILPEVSPSAIANAILYLKENPSILAKQREACLEAAKTENWEKEQLKLIALVKAAMGNQSL